MRKTMLDDDGATPIEYGLLVAGVAGVIFVGVAFFGTQVFALFSDTDEALAATDSAQSVSVPLPATVAEEPSPPGNSGPALDIDSSALGDAGPDSCASLPGRQPADFDCSLPLNVPALKVEGAQRVKYDCPRSDLYQLVRGQKLERNKICVLKSATDR